MVISFAAEFTAFENYASGRQINVIVARHDSARSLDLQPPPGPVIGCGKLSARNRDFRAVGYI